ncbi:hypothetical protein HID58_076538 [Brassica napus]|uniref:Uncharacterized protein n=1 Tax=Brassica napus TaxID=3708 RepID=A0ABQ7YQW8_BRANA|nr:hypothetical protein HID58_076538 [Brassica napus]
MNLSMRLISAVLLFMIFVATAGCGLWALGWVQSQWRHARVSRRAIGSRVHVLVQQTAETCVTTKVLAEVNAVVSVAVATAPDIADLWIVSHNSNLPYPSSGFVPFYLIFRTTPCRTFM